MPAGPDGMCPVRQLVSLRRLGELVEQLPFIRPAGVRCAVVYWPPDESSERFSHQIFTKDNKIPAPPEGAELTEVNL